MPAVAFYTLGCKVNQYESEALMDLFREKGYQITDFRKKADVYIINSCTVTNLAASKSRKYARRARRRNQEAVVALIGCYPQVSPEEVQDIEEIDLVLGTDNKKKMVDKVDGALASEINTAEITPRDQLDSYEDLQLKELRETTRANIKIQEGCNQFCSYCIIPYARGKLRSRTQDSVLTEVKRLTAAGVKEIVLTGIHLGAYGLERSGEQELIRLINRLLEVDTFFRIRLSSLEVTEVTSELLDLMATEERLCSHLHLPLQSGSNEILSAMNRPYSAEEYEKTVTEIKNRIPDIGLTTDVIVGFPGETGKNFQETKEFVRRVGFSGLHVFSFSAREGTPAAKMEEQIPGDVIRKRSQELRNIDEKLQQDFIKEHINSKRKVIIEEKRDTETDLLSGITDNYLRVLMSGDDELKGEMVEVFLLKKLDNRRLLGKILKKKEFNN